MRRKVCSTRPWLQVYLCPRCENWLVSTSESGGSGGNRVDGRVTEVTERSGRGTEVTERVQRLWRYAEFTERCMEGMEICGVYGDLGGGAVMRSKELY